MTATRMVMQDLILELNDLSQESSLITAEALETGRVLYLPNDGFCLKPEEQQLLTQALLAPGKKNISYDVISKKLGHLHPAFKNTALYALMSEMMDRFSDYAKSLVDSLAPSYQQGLRWGRTSFRPAKVSGRQTSLLKDDTRLHVDAFKSTPVKGQRILRVFSNIHPEKEPRVWHLGESFPDVLEQFGQIVRPYSKLKAGLMQFTKLTKTRRTAYDHFMLELHDQMKKSHTYQAKVKKIEFNFPANSTWMVFTDQVSHAALSGQFLLEQTFYLPVEAMVNPETSPLKQLEKLKPEEVMI
jgi:hypothetical protein